MNSSLFNFFFIVFSVFALPLVMDYMFVPFQNVYIQSLSLGVIVFEIDLWR